MVLLAVLPILLLVLDETKQLVYRTMIHMEVAAHGEAMTVVF